LSWKVDEWATLLCGAAVLTAGQMSAAVVTTLALAAFELRSLDALRGELR
jgi:hypothetical protein